MLFNGVTVPEEKEIELLGAAFDSRLSYSQHLRAVASKAAQRLHFLRKVAPLLDSSGGTAVYKGFGAANNGILLPGVDGVMHIQAG